MQHINLKKPCNSSSRDVVLMCSIKNAAMRCQLWNARHLMVHRGCAKRTDVNGGIIKRKAKADATKAPAIMYASRMTSVVWYKLISWGFQTACYFINSTMFNLCTTRTCTIQILVLVGTHKGFSKYREGQSWQTGPTEQWNGTIFLPNLPPMPIWQMTLTCYGCF